MKEKVTKRQKMLSGLFYKNPSLNNSSNNLALYLLNERVKWLNKQSAESRQKIDFSAEAQTDKTARVARNPQSLITIQKGKVIMLDSSVASKLKDLRVALQELKARQGAISFKTPYNRGTLEYEKARLKPKAQKAVSSLEAILAKLESTKPQEKAQKGLSEALAKLNALDSKSYLFAKCGFYDKGALKKVNGFIKLSEDKQSLKISYDLKVCKFVVALRDVASIEIKGDEPLFVRTRAELLDFYVANNLEKKAQFLLGGAR